MGRHARRPHRPVESGHESQAHQRPSLGDFRPVAPVLPRRPGCSRRARKSPPQQTRRSPQHARKQAHVEPGHSQGVEDVAEVRQASLRIHHPGGDVRDGRAGPEHADREVGIEVHLAADADVVDHGEGGGQRHGAIAAKGVADLQRQGREPYQPSGELACEDPAPGCARVEDGIAHYQGVRVLSHGRNEARDVGRVVLGVGVQMDQVGEAAIPGDAKSGLHGHAAASVVFAPVHLDPRVIPRHALELRPGGLVAPVVDDQAGKLRGSQCLHDAPDRAAVVVAGNQDADLHAFDSGADASRNRPEENIRSPSKSRNRSLSPSRSTSR